GVLRRHLGGFLQIPRFDQEVAPELLLGLGIRAVGDADLAVPGPQADRVFGGGERADLQQVTAPLQVLVERPALAADRCHLGFGQRLEFLLVVVGQAEVLHGCLSFTSPGRSGTSEIDTRSPPYAMRASGAGPPPPRRRLTTRLGRRAGRADQVSRRGAQPSCCSGRRSLRSPLSCSPSTP